MLENGTRDEAKLIFPIFFFFTYCKTHFYNIHFFPLTAPFYLNPYDTGRWCLKMGPEMKMNWSFPFSFSFHFFSLTIHHIISYTLHFQFTPSLFHFWHCLGHCTGRLHPFLLLISSLWLLLSLTLPLFNLFAHTLAIRDPIALP